MSHSLSGEGQSFGSSSSTIKLANAFLFPHSLSELLPYRSFDPETQLFLNCTSVGFVLETLPLVGCGEEIPRQLTGLFQHALPLGSNLQCLLIASPHIDPWLKTWEKARKDLIFNERSDVLRELAKERCSAFKNRSAIRTFRLLISYSEPHTTFKSFEDMIALREQLVTTLKGWGLPVKVWQASDLLLSLDELLNPTSLNETSLNETERLSEHVGSLWNPHDSLAHQLMSPATRIKIEPTQLAFGEEEKTLRLYTTRLLPPLWHLSAMGHLIGDPYDEFLRLQGGF
ncbi:MAG TPA: TraC family protein, partial [Alphaproteobacteria bacterium]|nr:TraC family protein [Alphaproteobacteria bacterium]